jgi:hypothetical protein
MHPGIYNNEFTKQHEIFMLQISWNYILMNQSSGRKHISIIKYNNEAKGDTKIRIQMVQKSCIRNAGGLNVDSERNITRPGYFTVPCHRTDGN